MMTPIVMTGMGCSIAQRRAFVMSLVLHFSRLNNKH
jgi:hypothetical protein